MMRTPRIGCLILFLAGSTLAAEATWEQDLRQMGYLFLHLSNINVVNGLNLTREQAIELYGLAKRIEAVAERPPTFRAPTGPELAPVRKTLLETRLVLVRGEEVSEELRERVALAREAESKAIRKTIRAAPLRHDTRCSSCHMAPTRDPSHQPMSVTAALKPLVDRAHIEGIYGPRGLRKLVELSPKVEAALSDAQKSVLSSFACCLVPPEDMSDPTRAGQAEVGTKALGLLRRVRRCPDRVWPVMRERVLQRVDQLAVAVRPGGDSPQRAAAREGVAKALDRARAASDVEFEMEKEGLAKELKAALIPPQGDAPHKAAYFLMIPGASNVYAAYIKRLDREKRAGAQ